MNFYKLKTPRSSAPADAGGTSASTPSTAPGNTTSVGTAQGTPGARQGLLPPVKRAVFGREVTYNAFVPGIGGTVERPVRASPEPSKVVAPTDEASRLAALSAQAQGLRARLPAAPSNPWERSARTTLNRLATAAVPWLKPRPLAEKATTHAGPAHPEKATAVPESGDALTQALEQRLGAEVVVGMARHQLTSAQAASTAASALAAASGPDGTDAAAKAVANVALQERTAQQTVQVAEARLVKAIALQEAHASAGGLQPLAAAAQAQQQRVDKDRFARQRLKDTKGELYGVQSAATGHLRELREAQDHLADANLHVETALTTQTEAGQHHENVQTAVTRAEAQLRAAQAGTGTVAPGAPARLIRLKALLAEADTMRQSAALAHAEKQAEAELAATRVTDLEADAELAREQLKAIDPGLSAVLQASMALASADLRAPALVDAKAAFEAREVQAMRVQATRPRGFAGGVESEQFGARLLEAVNGRPANPSADALPSIGVMEIASDLMSVVCQGDATRARQLLETLQSRPARHWMQDVADLPDHGTGSEPSGTETDVRNLLRQASVLPRGAEVVHLLGDPNGSMPDSETLQAMRSFWSADAAQRVEPDPSVRQWLAGAKRVAREMPADTDPGATAPVFTGAERAAYNAVRNGCVSNAADSPYGRHDDRMNKAIGEWLEREQPSRSWLRRVVTPHRQKTPFTSAGLRRATAIAESFGMDTPRSHADGGVRQTAEQLSDWAKSTLAQDLTAAGVTAEDAHAFATATQALAARAAQHDHPSQWRLNGSEGGELRAAAYSLQHPTAGQGTGRLHKPDRNHPLPPLFEEFAQQGVDAPVALRAIIDQVKLTLADDAPEDRQAVYTHDRSTHASADMARQQRFRSKEDVVRYFEPILLSMQLRDKLKLSGGGIVGGGLPSLPYSVPSPVVSPVFSAGWSRKEEAFFQVFMPILGMEISLGSTRTSGPEVTVGVAAGPDLPGVAKAQVSATEKMSRLHARTEGTMLRLFRQRGRDDEMRQEMLGVLDSWVRWDQVHAEGQPPYAGPLEAVLDRHPKISLGEIQGESLARTFVSRVSAGANLKLAGGDGQTYRVGVSAGASLKAERIAESRSEQGGHVSVTADKGDTAQQKLSVGVQVNSLTPANPSEVPLGPEGKHGAISGGGMPSLVEVSRDLYWNLEKHAVSPFTIGGKQDADLDRHYNTPAEMLKAIEQQREDWLSRCVETLEPDASGEKNTLANRNQAEELMRGFEARVQELGRDSRLCQYNVNLSMRPQASSWIDTFRALEGLAVLRGDAHGAAEARANADRTMAQDSTWRPLMLIVREKGRDVRTLGWNFGVRLQRSIGVEGQRTAAQFPPP